MCKIWGFFWTALKIVQKVACKLGEISRHFHKPLAWEEDLWKQGGFLFFFPFFFFYALFWFGFFVLLLLGGFVLLLLGGKAL